MTEEREKEILESKGHSQFVLRAFECLFTEIEYLRAENYNLSEAHEAAQHYKEERDQLKAENQQMTESIFHTSLTIFGCKSGQDLIAENRELREKLDVAVAQGHHSWGSATI